MCVAWRNFLKWGTFLVVFSATSGSERPAAAVPLIDFTNPAEFSGTSSGPLSGSVAGIDYQVSGTGGAFNFSEAVEGGTCPNLLACEQDGLGLGDDEISAGVESLTITFESATPIAGLHFLDLFTNPTGPEREEAHVSLDGGPAISILADVSELLGQSSGYRFFSLGGVTVSMLTFRAPDIQPQDGAGVNDFALAAVQLVPLPPSILMLLSAVCGIALLRRRRPAS